ncbi:XdhC family protein [Paenibacillus turpanensis]|uniref:XdhC family protein n=1 Tax=Paenibacillus turpanensis TaxID=2689078 RepID=UPI00140D5E8C|nr:XdhC family protein [Paenibacillus turpanensis]
MADVVDILSRAVRAGDEAVLATLVQVEGSSYRQAGTMMLLQQGHPGFGMLSAGCLEADLCARMEMGGGAATAPGLHMYDMSAEDDLGWGAGAGCNGVLHILTEPLSFPLRAALSEAELLLKAGRSCTFIRTISADWTKIEYEVWDTGGSMARENQAHQGQEPCWEQQMDGTQTITQHFDPKPRLIVYGAGADAKLVVTLAAAAGFQVWLCDWREGLLRPDNFPQAHRFVAAGSAAGLADAVGVKETDYVLVMTHQYDRDRELLFILKERPPVYAGLLGSRRRAEKLLAGEPAPEWLHAPVGLEIGAEGPEQIAVSIVAELIRVKQYRHRGGVQYERERRSGGGDLSRRRI